jgi:nucleotide-binding universal stress UspA family protein
MSIKDIIVYVDNDKNCENRLVSATRLCQTLEAQLTGLYLLQKISIPAYAGAYVPVEIFDANDEQTQKLRDRAESVFNAKCEAVGIGNHFHAVEGDVSTALNQYSRYSDLLIVPQRKNDRFDFNPYYQLSDVLLGAACPVLLLPDNSTSALPPETALLAWDGEHECARALSAAMPILSQVKKIDIVSINQEAEEAEEIAHHLSRHGIVNEVHRVEDSHLNISETLLDQAAKFENQMIIMGAYGHSRIRELMLGGTTRQILEHTTLPVLFSH